MEYPAEESSKLELKKTIPENNQIIKTIIGFCNQKRYSQMLCFKPVSLPLKRNI